MELSKIVTGVILLLVGVILVSALVVPTITGVQKTVGEKETLDNDVTGIFSYNIWDGEDLTITYVKGTPNVYTINGETLTLTISQNIVFASDFLSIRTGGAFPENPGLNMQTPDRTIAFEEDLNLVITNGAYALSLTAGGVTTTTTGPVNWLVYAIADGASGLGQIRTPSSPFYTSDLNNIVVLGNIYTTGDNDTYYAYFDGELTVNEAYADVSSVTFTKNVEDGYTDIYDTSVTVNVGDESFTPYFILAPIEVTGHEASGTAYTLFGLIPLLLIVSLVLVPVGLIAMRSYFGRSD